MPITKQQLLQILPNAGSIAGVFLPGEKLMTETEKDRDILVRTLGGEG